jgi:hypothetical protein
MKVSELIERLRDFDPNAEVITTWESTTHTIEPDSIYRAKGGMVVIDADANSYREEFESGVLPNEWWWTSEED